jgi:hypothetical protein
MSATRTAYSSSGWRSLNKTPDAAVTPINGRVLARRLAEGSKIRATYPKNGCARCGSTLFNRRVEIGGGFLAEGLMKRRVLVGLVAVSLAGCDQDCGP